MLENKNPIVETLAANQWADALIDKLDVDSHEDNPIPNIEEDGGPYGEPDAGDVDGISEAPGSTLAELENPLESAAAIFLEGDEFADLSDEDVHAVAFVEDAIGLEDLDLETAEEQEEN